MTKSLLDASSLYILLMRGELETLGGSKTLDLAFYEVGNALLKELRRRLISNESFKNALRVLNGLSDLMIVRRFSELEASGVAEVSRSTGLTFYDASYLTLALAEKETLATNDSVLRKEASKIGVKAISF